MIESIVVVDSEPVVRSVVTKILQREGYLVHSTDDVKKALEMIKNCTPKLVLTNVYLKGITGHDAMRLLKDHCPGLPVLMVSGLPDETAIQQWIGEDGFDTFPKPFQASALVDKVRKVIRRASEKDRSEQVANN